MEDTIIGTIHPNINGSGSYSTNHLEISHRLFYAGEAGWKRDIYKVDIEDIAGNMFTCVSDEPITIHRIIDKADGMVRVKIEPDTLIEWLLESIKRALAEIKSRHYIRPSVA